MNEVELAIHTGISIFVGIGVIVAFVVAYFKRGNGIFVQKRDDND